MPLKRGAWISFLLMSATASVGPDGHLHNRHHLGSGLDAEELSLSSSWSCSARSVHKSANLRARPLPKTNVERNQIVKTTTVPTSLSFSLSLSHASSLFLFLPLSSLQFNLTPSPAFSNSICIRISICISTCTRVCVCMCVRTWETRAGE